MRNIEQSSPPNPEQRESNVVKVEQFLEGASARYRSDGVPLGTDGRIDMNLYDGFYGDVKKDLQRNRDWETDWFKGLSEKEAVESRRLTDGEQLEKLTCAILIKNLGDQFVVARTSPHDDRVNKVDTIILDRGTGNLVCTFDEVGAISGPTFEKKNALVQERNLAGGVSLKYGIGTIADGGKKVIVPAAAEHLPLFYLAVPGDHIKKGMDEFIPNPVEQSKFEKQLFSYFLATINAQIFGLELYQKRLDGDLRKKLSDFKVVVGSLSARST